jgi:hypothetical protein
LGEVPSGPGVCVPHGFFTDAKQPATIGLNIRLKDQPDIVVFLLARDAATHEPERVCPCAATIAIEQGQRMA